ncbi:protein TIFY 10b-like [Forsythia ovata]|uniref:Protein TIFY n=1 Tax=Forsythia ovata TaxID=205694 RepID=A0ABD1QN12_9LAMI
MSNIKNCGVFRIPQDKIVSNITSKAAFSAGSEEVINTFLRQNVLQLNSCKGIHNEERKFDIELKSTNKTRRGATRKAPPGFCPLIPSKFGGGFRYPTYLEQQLLPMIIKGDDALTALSSDKSKGEQLTIFYDGVVNVYDNVSVDKAKAIMLLAGETSVSAPVTKNVQELEASKISQKSISPPVYKLQPNLPIATKRSLERFFNKRRDRLMNKSPCVTTSRAPSVDDCEAHEK